MQQGLRIAEQKAVGFVVQLSHLGFYTAQQTQLVEVAKGETCRLQTAVELGTLTVELAQQGYRHILYKRSEARVGTLLGGQPFVGIVHAIHGAFAKDVLAVVAVLEFDERRAGTRLFVDEVIDADAMGVQKSEKTLGISVQTALGIRFYGTKGTDVAVEKAGLADARVDTLALHLVELAEDDAAEVLHLTDDVP